MNKTNKTLILILLTAIGVGCGYSKPMTTMPTIAQLNPSMATAGSGQLALEVDGANFSASAVVKFNGASEPTTVVSSTKLNATIPASALMHSGSVPVTVTNPGSGGTYGMGAATSAAVNFTIN